MIGSFQILFPQPYVIEVSRLRRQLEEAHFAWVTEWRRKQDEFRMENIRFAHDPLWNERLFSLQAACNGDIWFWKATRIFVGFAGMSV